jgi:hypothetical protein
LIKELLGWLKNRLLGSSEYLHVTENKYLKSDGKQFSIVSKSSLPEEEIEEEDEDLEFDPIFDGDERPTQQAMETARIESLKGRSSYKVAQEAAKNSRVKSTVLQNPELVDADSRVEADLKVDIADGKDVTGTIESNPKLDLDSIQSSFEADFMSSWGYNIYGNQLASEIDSVDADAEAGSSTGDSGEAADGGDAGGEGDGIMGTDIGSDVGGAEASYSGGPSTSGYQGGGDSGSVSGVETGMSIDTDAGTVSTGGNTGSGSDGGSAGYSGGSSGSSGSGSSGSTGAGYGSGTGGSSN